MGEIRDNQIIRKDLVKGDVTFSADLAVAAARFFEVKRERGDGFRLVHGVWSAGLGLEFLEVLEMGEVRSFSEGMKELKELIMVVFEDFESPVGDLDRDWGNGLNKFTLFHSLVNIFWV